MGASVFVRASTAFMSQVELGLGSVERASRRGLSRLSIREIEAAAEDVLTQRFAAERERDLAARDMAAHRKAAADWGEKARYALSKERNDLAEQAIGRQIDAERDAQTASDREKAAAVEVERLEALMSELSAERKRMTAELAELDQSQQGAISGQNQTATAKHRVERARVRFDQMMDDERNGRPDVDCDTSAQEIDALRRADQVADRLAALRNDASGGSRKQRPAKRG